MRICLLAPVIDNHAPALYRLVENYSHLASRYGKFSLRPEKRQLATPKNMSPPLLQQSTFLAPDSEENRRVCARAQAALGGEMSLEHASARDYAACNDTLDDLSEISRLIDNLSAPLPGSDSQPSDFVASLLLNDMHANFAHDLEHMRALHLNATASMTRARSRSDSVGTIVAKTRKKILSLKSALRILYRQRSTIYCARDWQSPAYNASMQPGRNRLWQGIEAHNLDYKRDGHLDEQLYEQAFVQEYASQLGSDHLQPYMTNCGMAAFSTVLHLLAHELDLGPVTVGIEPMYFENVHLLRPFFPSIQLISPTSRQHLKEFLDSAQPSIVFLDAASNRGQVFHHDLESVMQWAMSANHAVTLVIDNTCVPCPLLPEGLLAGLPPRISVILIESLAKYHQFGMDTVTGGIILAHADEALNSHLRKTREVLGTNITDASVPSLPVPHRAALERRLNRHSRNLTLLATRLEEELSQQIAPHAIESIAWPQNGMPGTACPSYRGTCLTITLLQEFRTVPHYRQFESKMVELSKQADYPLILGTSFGFDVTRLFITTPATAFEEPYMRLSIGTETAAEVHLLTELILTASKELASTWRCGKSPRQY